MTALALTDLAYPLPNASNPDIQDTSSADFGDGSASGTYHDDVITAAFGYPRCHARSWLVKHRPVVYKGTLRVAVPYSTGYSRGRATRSQLCATGYSVL
ncbi:hypothetical protein DL766_010455 [Monosporascus sp. MC13-8B]|uniref:Uncharacterized protein n=1 Tax=Monosporascus cannonballus TaxID=155416 RepID=A0ABY0GXS0_9PEZI|nr:hypothetical protein DL762_008106 [Monosporascus cannonballus]RYO81958.1 hypothetical protein DL763_008409 [Monosporascus cannonballus]RYP01809.1 hypothetical protein DL766_010455 [Monosporascus sp. MC13-8B]